MESSKDKGAACRISKIYPIAISSPFSGTRQGYLPHTTLSYLCKTGCLEIDAAELTEKKIFFSVMTVLGERVLIIILVA